MKTKKTYLDILRVVAIFMVFHFHFILALGEGGLFLGYANGDWGCVGTTLFFFISGNCLARNYGKELNVKKFYITRWLAIFPMFYLCYLIALLGNLLLKRPVFEGVAAWRVIYTILGIDSYADILGYENMALVGEWYTAIILCVYLLFPLLQLLYRKNKVLSSLFILVLYVLNLLFTWGPASDDAHLITGVTMFWIGMLTYHFEEQLEHMPWSAFTGILLCALALFFIEVPGPALPLKNLMALLIFFLFMRLEEVFQKFADIKPISFLSRIEYGIYLSHHAIIFAIPVLLTPIVESIHPVIYYIACVGATIVFSSILTSVTQPITSKLKTILVKK